MPELSQSHIADLRAHSITTWPRVYLACGVAFALTFVSSGILSGTPAWTMVTAFCILFSVVATLYALTSLVLTTYYEASAKHNFAGSLFSTSPLPLAMFIAKEALKPQLEGRSK